MNKGIFITKPFVKRSLLQKVFKQERDENCVIEINNLFATKSIEDISKIEIEEIINRFGKEVFNDFSLNFEEFYVTYLNECCKNGIISDQEMFNIQHMMYLLNIAPDVDTFYRQKIAPEIIQERYNHLLQKNVVERDLNNFAEITDFLKIDPKYVDAIKQKLNSNFKNHMINPFRDKKRITKQELDALEKTFKEKNIKLGASTKEEIKRYFQYWQLENKEIIPCSTKIAILKSEICLYEEEKVAWYESRSERGYSSYKFIKQGKLTMTDKRIYFTTTESTSKLTYVQISSILDLEDTILIKKYKGKEPKLKSHTDQTILAIMMKGIWNKYGL